MSDEIKKGFFNKHPKLTAILLAAGIAMSGHTVADIIIDYTEASSYNTAKDKIEEILYNIDKACPYEVTSITNVEASAKEGEETGKVTVYAKAKTPKGKEYSCSFAFTGETKDVENIDKQAFNIYNDYTKSLKKSGEELDGKIVMRKLVKYLTSVERFIEENNETCEYINVAEQGELLMETVTAEDGTTSKVAYNGHAVWNRFFQFENANSDGLTEKKDLDDLKKEINTVLKKGDYECQTYIHIDLTTKKATLATELYGTNLTVVLNVEQWINEANTIETRQIIEYVKTKALEFLKTDDKLANKMIYEENIISETVISSVYSNGIWRSLNNHILVDSNSAQDALSN